MKKFIPLCILIVALLVSCQKPGSDGYTGGHESSRDPFAKTTVKNKAIQSFYFYIEHHDRPMGAVVVEINPAKEKEANHYKMTLYYHGPGIKQDEHTYELMLDEEQMKAIGTALADSGMLGLNGITNYTQGIPPDSGTYVLRAKFVSGEKYDFVVNGGFSGEFRLRSYDWMNIIWDYFEEADMDMSELKDFYEGNLFDVIELDEEELWDEEIDEDDLPTGEESE